MHCEEPVAKVDLLKLGRCSIQGREHITLKGLVFEVDVVQEQPHLKENESSERGNHERDKKTNRVLCQFHRNKYTNRPSNGLAALTILNIFSHLLTWLSESFSEC